MTRLERLVALRDLLTDRLAEAKPGESASLSKELRSAMAEIAALEALVPRKSVVDDLAKARNTRRARNAKGRSSAKDGEQTGTS